MKLSSAAMASLAQRLPAGYDVANVRVISVEAVLVPETHRLASEIERAGGVPLITDGKPTIMRVVAWVAHEGINKNRLAFLAEDLEEAAQTIVPPNILPMDFNHSAVNQWSMETPVIGAWYAAEVQDDPNARPPRKSRGLLAKGMIWSALFPKYSTRLLAEQARTGHLEFSMACVPQWTEAKTDEDGEAYELARKPVFFTFSALDVPPADPDAKGLGKEGAGDSTTEETLRQQLLQQAALSQDSNMNLQEILDFIKANAGSIASQETLLETQSRIEGLIEVVKQSQGTSAVIEDLTTKLAEAQEKIASLEGQVADASTALTAATAQATELQRLLDETGAKLAEADARLAAYDAEKEAAAKQERLAARIAELPEPVQQVHAAKEESKRLATETRWASMSDEEWAEVREMFTATATISPSYLARSLSTSSLPTKGAEGITPLARFRS